VVYNTLQPMYTYIDLVEALYHYTDVHFCESFFACLESLPCDTFVVITSHGWRLACYSGRWIGGRPLCLGGYHFSTRFVPVFRLLRSAF
jgi:hypothetical protein